MKATKLAGLTLGVSLFVAAPTAAYADVVTFNFEGSSLASGLTTLTLSSGGLTATLTRPGSNFAIVDESPFIGNGVPVSWGIRTLSPFDDAASNTPFVLNFSQAITGLAIQMGDFGADTDVLTIQLFSGLNGTGTLLGSATPLTLVPGSDFSFLTPSASASGALSAVFIGGSTDFPNSVFYDNLAVTFGATTATPEPATLALMATGLVGVGFIRRKKRV